jgi:hypothetical protein
MPCVQIVSDETNCSVDMIRPDHLASLVSGPTIDMPARRTPDGAQHATTGRQSLASTGVYRRQQASQLVDTRRMHDDRAAEGERNAVRVWDAAIHRAEVVSLSVIRMELEAVLAVDAGAVPGSGWDLTAGPNGLPVVPVIRGPARQAVARRRCGRRRFGSDRRDPCSA